MLDEFERSLRYYPYVDRLTLYHLRCAHEEKCLASSANGQPSNSLRHLLRFSSLTMNLGRADFLPNALPHEWQWHTCHRHYHSFEAFINYDILDLRGNKVAEGHKASFCLEDSFCRPGARFFYRCSTRVQGISVNCGDRYGRHLDCQWIDITGLAPGTYVLRQIVNPNRESIESDYLNNEIRCTIVLTNRNYFRLVQNSCIHSGRKGVK